MSIDPQNDPQVVANSPTVQSTPASLSTPLPAASTPASAPTSGTSTDSTQPVQQPTQPTQPNNTNQQPDSVSNAPAAVHPSVQRASVLRSVAEALAGGPRYSTSIDPSSGATVRTQIPMSRSDIGMALALEIVSGSLAGLSPRGPGATGAAAAAGFQQGQQQAKEVNQADKEAAQQQYQNETQALVRKCYCGSDKCL